MNDTITKYTTRAIDPNLLSVLDVNTNGKVVSAQKWTELWALVFSHINDIDAFCMTIDGLRIDWQQSVKDLNDVIKAFEEKYNALSKSFVHYGETPPTNEHTLFWVKPVNDPKSAQFVTHYALDKALADKVIAFNPTDSTTLRIPFYKAVKLATNSDYLIERYRASQDLTNLFIQSTDTGGMGSSASFVIPKDTNITMIYTRRANLNAVDGSYIASVAVLLDSAILYTPSYYDNEVSTGYYNITAVVNADGTISPTNLKVEFVETASTAMLTETVKVTNVTLTVEGWTLDASTGTYVQSLGLGNITANSKIDLNLTVRQLNDFHKKDITFVTANENKVVKVYCIGQKPDAAYTVQVTITEVTKI